MKKARGILIAGLMIFGITVCGELTLKTNHPFVQLLCDTFRSNVAEAAGLLPGMKEVGKNPGIALPSEQVEKDVLVMKLKKIEKGLSLEKLGEIAGVSPVYMGAVLNAQHRLDPEAAKKVAEALGLDAETAAVLTACHNRNKYPCTIDPFLYRMVELLGVYGDAMRDQFNEKFGDGIMSAIVFKLELDKEVVDGADWVVIRMKGKFLPYLEILAPGTTPPAPPTGTIPGMKLTEEQVEKAVAVMQAKKREKGLTLDKLGEITGRNPVYIGAVLNGQHRLHPEAAVKLAQALDLDGDTSAVLTAPLVRTKSPNTLDPFLYRIYEIIGVYGDAMRDALNEKFGDGIMSAITFFISVDKEVVEGVPFVVITWKGKFLPYASF